MHAAIALTDLGLPAGDVALALFAFNCGVEFGQLAFVAAVFGAFAVARNLAIPVSVEALFGRALPYAIGTLAAFWLFERIAGFAT